MNFSGPKEYSFMYTQLPQCQQINRILLNYCDKKDIITDATACIGGNSSFFCAEFFFVYCIEIDEEKIKFLNDNLKNYTNKQIFNTDYLSIMKSLKQNIVFLDPPWGGKDYKLHDNIELFLSGKNVNIIIDELYEYTKIICLKIPNNYKFILPKKWHHEIHPIYKFSRIIFNIIIYYK